MNLFYKLRNRSFVDRTNNIGNSPTAASILITVPGSRVFHAKCGEFETYIDLLVVFPVAVLLAGIHEGEMILKNTHDSSQLGEIDDHSFSLVAPISTMKVTLMIYL